MKSEIRLVKKKFQSGVRIDEHGDFKVNYGGLRYVGEPSPEIDEAWDQLLEGEQRI